MYVCCGVAATVSNTRCTNSTGTRAWNRSLMLLTKIRSGWCKPCGVVRVSGCSVSPNPGPEVRGSPSTWYFADPIALSRRAIVRA